MANERVVRGSGRSIRSLCPWGIFVLFASLLGTACSDALVDPETSRVTASSVNKAPVAADDSVTIRLGEEVTINVLRNDTDSDGTLDLSTLEVSQPENGMVVQGADSSVTYTPNGDFVGRDQFSYTVKDDFGVMSASATVSIIVVLGPPQPPDLLEPVDGAVDVPLPARMAWGTSPFVLEYNIQVSAEEDFSTIAFESIQPTREVDAELNRSTTYFWRVRGINVIDAGRWSPVRSFSTIPGPPGLPALVSPANGAVGVPLEPELEWEPLPTAESYRLQIADNVAFASALVDDVVQESSASVQAGLLVASKRYFWRVRGENLGGAGAWSPTWSFVTLVVPPAAPQLAEPLDGADQVSLTPRLIWQRVEGAGSYQVEVAGDASFSDVVYSSTDSTIVRSIPGDVLSSETAYYWRVRAGNIAGFSPWSATWGFTTAPPAPTPPSLLAPENGAVGVTLQPVLSWSAAAGALEYHLQVAKDVTFLSPALDQTTAETSLLVESVELEPGVRYFWRVRSINAGGFSGWTATWFFDTAASP